MTTDDSARPGRPSRRTWLLSAAALAIATGSTTSRAKDTRTVKFVYADNFPPLSYLDKGVLRGHQKVMTGHGDGEITSGSFSPTLQQSIALARLPLGEAASRRAGVNCRIGS